MKRYVIAVVAIMLLWASGAAAQNALPQLVGTWRGQSEVLLGTSNFSTQDVEFVILKQQGHLFTGVKRYVKEPERIKTEETFTGVILNDARMIAFSDSDTGYNFAIMTGPDRLEIAYVHDGLGKKQPSMACFLALTRQK
ncbi:hypothetical protein [Solidesulfovibrio sp.]|uniref:hypothetical protein n=1 Tax=Solidesulfovibrio sp. TaxID=2910990 RepID=UPI002634349D|nr:hypothetical protein [Solidesulfovibrio sp.]